MLQPMNELFTDFQEALTRAMERSAAKSTDSAYLTELLQISYGTSKLTSQIVYRPFWVAARYLQQSRRDQTIKSADGAEFTGQAIPIDSLLELQKALDYDLDIRPQFRVQLLETPSLTQLRSAYDSALVNLRQYQPRGVL